MIWPPNKYVSLLVRQQSIEHKKWYIREKLVLIHRFCSLCNLILRWRIFFFKYLTLFRRLVVLVIFFFQNQLSVYHSSHDGFFSLDSFKEISPQKEKLRKFAFFTAAKQTLTKTPFLLSTSWRRGRPGYDLHHNEARRVGNARGKLVPNQHGGWGRRKQRRRCYEGF